MNIEKMFIQFDQDYNISYKKIIFEVSKTKSYFLIDYYSISTILNIISTRCLKSFPNPFDNSKRPWWSPKNIILRIYTICFSLEFLPCAPSATCDNNKWERTIFLTIKTLTGPGYDSLINGSANKSEKLTVLEYVFFFRFSHLRF